MNDDIPPTSPMRADHPEARETDRLRWLTPRATLGAYTGRRKLARVFQNAAAYYRAALVMLLDPVTLS
jgi:hypothetical protein